jgi:hypothetical protein
MRSWVISTQSLTPISVPTAALSSSKERQDGAPLQLAANDNLACGVNSVDLKDRFGDI